MSRAKSRWNPNIWPKKLKSGADGKTKEPRNKEAFDEHDKCDCQWLFSVIQSFSHRSLQDENIIAYCVKKEDLSQLKSTALSNSHFPACSLGIYVPPLLCNLCCSSDTDMHTLKYKGSLTLTFQLHDECSSFLRGLRGGERWWVSYREQSVPIMEILEGEGGLLIELGRDAILSERLALLPTTPPQDSLYSRCWKDVWRWRAIGGTQWLLHRVNGC